MSDTILKIWEDRTEKLSLYEEIITLENAIRIISINGIGIFSEREYQTTLYSLFLMKDQAHAKLQPK